MKIELSTLVGGLCALPLFLFGWSAHADLNVVTTTTDLAALAQAVGRDDVSVTSLTPGTRDPHFAEAKPSMIRKVNRADLVIAVGAELEIGWLPAALESGRNPAVYAGRDGYLDLSQHVELLDIPTGPVTRDMGDVHQSGNPHYWLDPANGIRMARAIAERLSVLDPENTAAYQARLGDFEKDLVAKRAEWQRALEPLANEAFVQYHRSLTYLAHAFDLRIVDEIEPLPGIAPSVSDLVELTAVMEQEQVRGILIESYYDRRPAEFLSEKTGAAVIALPQSVGAAPGIENYFDLLDGIVAAFQAAGVI